MTIWERVKSALTPLSLPMAQSVMIMAANTPLPAAYIVYFLVSSTAVHHADNAEKLREQTVQVTYYSRAGLAGMPDIQSAMVAAGFTAGPQREIPYNRDTRHFGLALDFNFLEVKEQL